MYTKYIINVMYFYSRYVILSLTVLGYVLRVFLCNFIIGFSIFLVSYFLPISLSVMSSVHLLNLLSDLCFSV